MCTVLIIEDDMDLQEGLAYSLEAEGYSIIAASTMEEGKSSLEKTPVISFFWTATCLTGAALSSANGSAAWHRRLC